MTIVTREVKTAVGHVGTMLVLNSGNRSDEVHVRLDAHYAALVLSREEALALAGALIDVARPSAR